MPLDLETLCLEILEAKELVANISIRVVDEQHPTPGASPLYQMGLLVLVCITNGGGWIEYGLAMQPLLGSGSCGQGY